MHVPTDYTSRKRLYMHLHPPTSLCDWKEYNKNNKGSGMWIIDISFLGRTYWDTNLSRLLLSTSNRYKNIKKIKM